MSQTVQATQMAVAQQLGNLREEYRVKLSGVIRFSAILWSLATLGWGLAGLISAGDPYSSSSSTEFWIAAICALPALYYLFNPVIYRSWSVSVYSEGFTFAHGGKLDVFRWDQIESIQQSTVYRTYRFFLVIAFTLSLHKYRVRSQDGRQILLKNRISDMDGLMKTISGAQKNIIWPQIIAAYNAGNTLPFGRLSVNQQGLSNGQELIAWEQVKEVQLNEKTGVYSIKKEGKTLNWFSARSFDIPNLAVLQDLVNAGVPKKSW
jgi:hypothetical protein